MNGQYYSIFIERALPELLQDIPLLSRRDMWYQHDGAPQHYTNNIVQLLQERFNHRWIGRNGPVLWPPRSPDLNPIDFFLWGHVKEMVYETLIENAQDLMGRMVEAFARVKKIGVSCKELTNLINDVFKLV